MDFMKRSMALTSQEELKVRRIGHNAMLEQDAVHISGEADLAAHVLDCLTLELLSASSP